MGKESSMYLNRMRKVKQARQEKTGRIKFTNSREPVVSLVDNEKLNLRMWVDSDSYKGKTKKGLRFYLYHENGTEFKELVHKVDKVLRRSLKVRRGWQ